MNDLVARLRDADTTRRIGESYADTHERRQRDRNEAADTITTLNERNAEYIGTIDRLRRRVAETDVEIERLRADLAHADAKGQENDKLLWGTIKANERLRAALKDIRDHSLELYATGVARAALALPASLRNRMAVLVENIDVDLDSAIDGDVAI